ncbi:MAG: DCC1-like thiol-disulfide oxidoreductase family protein [Cyanobacteria bacterium P01_H01_bin.21]
MFAHWFKPLERRYGLDLRSLALLRLGLALVILSDLWGRWGNLLSDYSDQGTVPRSLLQDLWLPGYWSIHALSGSVWWQVGCFAIATLSALLLLIGYRTRWAIVISWVLLVSLHNRNPLVVSAADDVLRAIVFWAMFLPLGSSYSVDQALNMSPTPQPRRILTVATFGLMVQQCYIHIGSALTTTMAAGGSTDASIVPLALIAWATPLLLWSPIKTDLCRMVAVVVGMLLYLGVGLTLNLGLLPVIGCFTWLVFIPSSVWDRWSERVYTSKQLGLKIYYDAECGFCKKVVHFLRTFLVLPRRVPLQIAQSDPVIQTAMETQNSWVIVDWQGNHHYKWHGIAYVVSLSPILHPLAKVLRWSPLMAIGTRIYETIANNRRFAGNFTKPFKYQSFTVRPINALSWAALLSLLLMTLLNLQSVAANTQQSAVASTRSVTNNPAMQYLASLGQATRLDQSWNIFSPESAKTNS